MEKVLIANRSTNSQINFKKKKKGKERRKKESREPEKQDLQAESLGFVGTGGGGRGFDLIARFVTATLKAN